MKKRYPLMILENRSFAAISIFLRVIGYSRTVFTFVNLPKTVYGAYWEGHYGADGKLLPDSSILILRPRFTFFGIKCGLIIEGVCFKRTSKKSKKGYYYRFLREFESLDIKIICKKPLMVDYGYFAIENGSQYSNCGSVRFRSMENDVYTQAEGYFILPPHPISGSMAWNRGRISFSWRRIPADQIRHTIGKHTFNSIGDIRRFLEGQNTTA